MSTTADSAAVTGQSVATTRQNTVPLTNADDTEHDNDTNIGHAAAMPKNRSQPAGTVISQGFGLEAADGSCVTVGTVISRGYGLEIAPMSTAAAGQGAMHRAESTSLARAESADFTDAVDYFD